MIGKRIYNQSEDLLFGMFFFIHTNYNLYGIENSYQLSDYNYM